jgi:hypothetical protein
VDHQRSVRLRRPACHIGAGLDRLDDGHHVQAAVAEANGLAVEVAAQVEER